MASAQGHITVRRRAQDGRGISSVTVYYGLSASGTTAPSSWSTSVQAPTATNRYLWSYEKTVYTDGTTGSTEAHVIGVYGDTGLQGCIVRVSEWAEGVEYRNDEALTGGTRYLDIAVVTGSTAGSFTAYQCLKTHTSSSSIPVSDTTCWSRFNTLAPVYTPLIMAENALLRFAQTNRLLVMKSDGSTVNAAMGGGSWPLWVGATDAEAAPFRVSDEGKLVATGAEIQGKITAESGKIAGLTISGDAITNTPFDNSAYIIIRNDDYKTFAGIGANVAPVTSGCTATARFENCDSSGFFGGRYGTNYAMLVSAQGAGTNVAMAIDGGCISGMAMKNTVISSSVTSKYLTRDDYNVLCCNSNELSLYLPEMNLYDDGHVIRFKRLGNGAVKIYMKSCYTYNGSASRYSAPFLIYEKNANKLGTNDPLYMESVCDSMELVWVRDLTLTSGSTTYYGGWVQYILPRQW